jgi:hypothetical protein
MQDVKKLRKLRLDALKHAHSVATDLEEGE